MLVSEFTERTGVQLEPEEYQNVETMYNEVKMNKDDFCKEWKKLYKNPLMKEIVESFAKFRAKEREISDVKAQLAEEKRVRLEMLTELAKRNNERFVDFAKRIILANEEDDLHVYDTIEEECGIAFIIQTKHDADIPLSDKEISYMVSKL